MVPSHSVIIAVSDFPDLVFLLPDRGANSRHCYNCAPEHRHKTYWTWVERPYYRQSRKYWRYPNGSTLSSLGEHFTRRRTTLWHLSRKPSPCLFRWRRKYRVVDYRLTKAAHSSGDGSHLPIWPFPLFALSCSFIIVKIELLQTIFIIDPRITTSTSKCTCA